MRSKPVHAASTMPMTLSVEFHFSAAHLLPHYDGPCNRLHGHNYVLHLILEGRPSPKDGMIRDFDEVKRRAWDVCLKDVDHHYMNDLMENPTAENMVIWLWDKLAPHFPGLVELKLWETPEYCVTYRP